MAVTLGLSFLFHDSAAAIVRDGQVVAAVAEERLCRRKHTNEFPKLAIEYCLDAAQLRSINDVDAIVFYEKPVTKFMRVVETLVSTWPKSFRTFTQQLPPFLSSKLNIQGVIAKSLPGYRGPILFSEHHLSHAASAFYCSPYDRAAVLTIDGVGEWETTAIGIGEGRNLRLDRAIHFPHSIGLFYSALTSYLGFRVNDGEWKVMGLAPYGRPTYLSQMRQLVKLHGDGSFALDLDYFSFHYSNRESANSARWQQLLGIPPRHPDDEITERHQDLAHSGQVVAEELILNLARAARRQYDCDNLVIAGGVGLNSVANWKIEAEGIFKNVWIQPAAGDDGGALGAALVVSQQLFDDPPSAEMKHAYLGPEFSDRQVAQFLELKQIPHTLLTDDQLVAQVADLIAAGKVVGWCEGRMEFGPRALGARSILADATNAGMKAIINEKIKYREYFRPFAPVVPLEHVHEYFDVPPGTDLPFMLKIPQVRPEKRDVIPAVTHADNSARVQTITEAVNPLYYRMLKALGARTGAPIAINTSFNVRGEPIVCSPEDAYRCFINSGIDALVVGRYLVTEKPAAIDHGDNYRRSDNRERGVEDDHAPLPIARTPAAHGDTAQQVLSFYRELPFNYYSNAVDTAAQLMRSNRIKAYPVLHRHLKSLDKATVLDVGCGAGWFSNSCAHFYGHQVTGIDVNADVLAQARSVARLLPGCEHQQFIAADVFKWEPGVQFDVVNSLGVLHHTPDCHGAIRRVLPWIRPGGYLHLGLYHSFGRRPFLDHFRRMQEQGASEAELLAEFAGLNPEITDATHMLSWFRDQVLHPHETQHSYQEIQQLLEGEGLVVEASSINNFRAQPRHETLYEMERRLEERSKAALYKRKAYFPGFFVVWARRPLAAGDRPAR